jgi:hypothetical protein
MYRRLSWHTPNPILPRSPPLFPSSLPWCGGGWIQIFRVLIAAREGARWRPNDGGETTSVFSSTPSPTRSAAAAARLAASSRVLLIGDGGNVDHGHSDVLRYPKRRVVPSRPRPRASWCPPPCMDWCFSDHEHAPSTGRPPHLLHWSAASFPISPLF